MKHTEITLDVYAMPVVYRVTFDDGSARIVTFPTVPASTYTEEGYAAIAQAQRMFRDTAGLYAVKAELMSYYSDGTAMPVTLVEREAPVETNFAMAEALTRALARA